MTQLFSFLKYSVFLLVSALTAMYAVEYTGCLLEKWGVGLFVPIDIFYHFGHTDNLDIG